jgi:hypothetical protein
MRRVLRRTSIHILCAIATLAVSGLLSGGAHATLGTCDTAGPIEVEATILGPGPTAYASLGAAFAAVSRHPHRYQRRGRASTSECDGRRAEQQRRGSASYTTLSIWPRPTLLTISGASVTGRGVIELNGADNVTIDGDNPNSGGTNRDLTIANTAVNTTTFTSVVRLALSTVVTSANGNTVRNCVINGSATGRNIAAATSTAGSETTTYGILVGGGATTVAGGTTAPSPIASLTTTIASGQTVTSFTASNNLINAVARGIAVQGAAVTVANLLSVTNNVIGSAADGDTTTVYSRGILVLGFDNLTVTGNLVRNMAWFVGTQQMAIAIGDVAFTVTGTNGLIANNVVLNQNNRATGTFGAYGININAGNNQRVQNNVVARLTGDMTGGAAFSTTFGLFGIRVASGTGHKVYHNSVNMFGLRAGTPATNLLSAAFGITVTGLTGTDVRNNIFSNTITGGTTSIAHVAVYLPPSGTTANMNLTWNNNAYYTGTTAGVHGVAHVNTTYLAVPAGPTTYNGLYTVANFSPGATTPNANFRAYTSTLSAGGTNDNASLASSAAAPFTSSTDLHINTGLLATQLESGGASAGVTLVTTDFDNDVRPGPAGSVNGGATNPDIGVDEFDGVPPVANDVQATAFLDPTNGGSKPAGVAFSPSALHQQRDGGADQRDRALRIFDAWPSRSTTTLR